MRVENFGTGVINEKQSSALHNDYSYPAPAKRDSDIIDLAKFTVKNLYMSFMSNFHHFI